MHVAHIIIEFYTCYIHINKSMCFVCLLSTTLRFFYIIFPSNFHADKYEESEWESYARILNTQQGSK